MAMVCSLNGNGHKQLKQRSLTLALLDLIFITITIIIVITQLIGIGVTFSAIPVENALNSSSGSTVSTELPPPPSQLPVNDTNGELVKEDVRDGENEVSGSEGGSGGGGRELVQVVPCNSTTTEGCMDEDLIYRTVVGARISLSIQLIIYITQLGFGVLLFIAAYHNDSRNLHLWVLFSEVIVVVICLNLFINFFGKFLWTSVIFTGLYIVFKIFLIRLIRRFIHVNDLELTQFGSVGEFD